LNGGALPLVLGLVYGYIPFFILPLYAALDRIDTRLLEASRDLDVGPVRTFLHVTLPLSRQGLLASSVITVLPMFGDYYTHDLVSPSNRTSMIGNQIDQFLRQSSGQRTGAALVLALSAFLAILMAYYLYSTSVAAREAR
jgi:spermidine/putrescine transport system permease protein